MGPVLSALRIFRNPYVIIFLFLIIGIILTVSAVKTTEDKEVQKNLIIAASVFGGIVVLFILFKFKKPLMSGSRGLGRMGMQGIKNMGQGIKRNTQFMDIPLTNPGGRYNPTQILDQRYNPRSQYQRLQYPNPPFKYNSQYQSPQFNTNSQYQSPPFKYNSQYPNHQFNDNSQYQSPPFNTNSQYPNHQFNDNSQYQSPQFNTNPQYQY
jgi:hypothetical protein